MRSAFYNVSDFGARGDGVANDTSAFQAAAAAINAAGGGTLVLQPRVYLVGRQTFAGSIGLGYACLGQTVLEFNDCARGVRIIGQGAKLRLVDGLKYGAFDPVTGESYAHALPFTDHDYAAGVVGAGLIGFNRCAFVSVQDLEIDGNSAGAVLGGYWGDTGRQLGGAGLYLNSNDVVELVNVSSHHNCLDGVTLTGSADLDSAAKHRIEMRGCSFEYNGRQGASICDASSGLHAVSCKFNHTGKGAIMSAPGAGVDIEPDLGSAHELRFDNCEFLDNAGVGMVCDSSTDTDTRRDALFYGCTFWGTTSWAIWPRASRFRFVDCNIYGASIVQGAAASRNANQFVRCHFEDREHPTLGVFRPGYLLDGGSGTANMLVEDCTLIANATRFAWIDSSVGVNGPAEWARFQGCKFVFKWAAHTDMELVANFGGAVFSNTLFVDELGEASPPANGWYISGGASIVIDQNVHVLGPHTLLDSWSVGGGGRSGLIAQTNAPAASPVTYATGSGTSTHTTAPVDVLDIALDAGAAYYIKAQYVARCTASTQGYLNSGGGGESHIVIDAATPHAKIAETNQTRIMMSSSWTTQWDLSVSGHAKLQFIGDTHDVLNISATAEIFKVT